VIEYNLPRNQIDAELEDVKECEESIYKDVETVQKRYVNAVKRTPNYEDGLLDLVSVTDTFFCCNFSLKLSSFSRSSGWNEAKLFVKIWR
jgi:hypothetical protein